MSFRPTLAQQKAIDNRGALLVSAAAGSGKTAVLVERVVQCVLDPVHPVDIDRLLVVTFTNAAAGEMKERIRRRLGEEYAKDPQNLRLLQQQMLLEKADIATIDSFCKNLVIRYFDKLSVSPDFTLISGNSLELLKKETMNEVLNFFFETRNREFSRLARMVGADQGTKHLQTAMETVYSYMRSLPFPQMWTDMVRKQYRAFTTIEQSVWGQAMLTRAKGLLKRGIASLSGTMRLLPEDPVVEEKRGERINSCLTAMKQALTAVEQEGWDQAAAACRQVNKISFQGKKLPNGYESAVKEATASAQTLSEKISQNLQELFALSAEQCRCQCEEIAPMIDLLLDAVWEYSNRLDQKKKDRNCMDFSDVEYRALELLVTLENEQPVPTPYAQEVFDDYDYVMVDEYQDVNDLQSAIFNAVTQNGKNLFAVGDVKQSIYRFRKANPKNFIHLLEEYPWYDGVCSPGKLVLDGNFRSRDEICCQVNGLFRFVMSQTVGEITYDDSHTLNAMAEFPLLEQPAVTLDFLQADDDRTAIALEADRIAHHIRRVTTLPSITKNGKLVPAEYGDCVILLRGLKNRGQAYAERLQEHGIPVVTEQAQGFFERQEVAQVVSILQVLNNPTDDVAMLACLLSPGFGFTANEVAAVRRTNKKVPLYICLQTAAEEGNEKVRRLLDALQALRVYAATVPAAKVLRRLYHDYGLLGAVAVMENGPQCRQNLLTLKEMAQECEAYGYDRLDGFLRYIDKLQQEEVTVTPKSAGTGIQAVRIMTIHHAKGLQFPVCFVAGCGTLYNRSDASAPVLLDEKLGLGLTLTDDAKRLRFPTCMRLAVAAQNRRAELSEELRVLYVAMTRAVDQLILLTTASNMEKKVQDGLAILAEGVTEERLDPELVLGSNNYGQLLLWYGLVHPAGGALRTQGTPNCGFLAVPSQGVQIGLIPAYAIELPEQKTEAEAVLVPEESLYRRVTERLTRQDPYLPLRSVFSKRSVSQLIHPEQYRGESAPRPSFLQEGGLSAAERGTALHQFMQYADYQKAAIDVRSEIDRMVGLQFLTPRQGKAVSEEKLQRFFAGDLYARMAASTKVMREHRFMSCVPVTQLDRSLPEQFAQETVVVQGITDCVFYEGDGLVLVDYKTDQVDSPEELVLRYRPQLLLYAGMLKQTYGLPVRELILYSFCLDRPISVATQEEGSTAPH